MGNQTAVIPQNYKQFTHPELKDSRFNKTQQLIQVRIHPGQSLSNWRWNLSPLDQIRKHLFLPVKFVDPELSNNEQSKSEWCQSGDRLSNSSIFVAQYQPFVYTLENEILTRKANNSIFREHQLWKILKIGTFAIRDWSHVYQDIIIGNITPRSILFNNEGQVRIANRFSFLNNSEEAPQFAYIPPLVPPALNNPTYGSGQTNQSLSIFSLGVSLLDAVSLSQSRYSAMPTIEKKEFLQKSNLYPLQIKRTILGMAQPDYRFRFKLRDILESLSQYKRLSRNKFQ